MANARDFRVPVASYQDLDERFTIYNKVRWQPCWRALPRSELALMRVLAVAQYASELWKCGIDHSPFDVVAWHGNYVPYKYNLDNFCTMNSVSFDHPVRISHADVVAWFLA